MKRIKIFSQLLLVVIFLSSCRTSINKDKSIINSEEKINEKNSLEKKRIEIKFSCGEDRISEYLNDGWIILKEESQEKICTWKLFLPQKIVTWKKIKDARSQSQIKLEKRKFIY